MCQSLREVLAILECDVASGADAAPDPATATPEPAIHLVLLRASGGQLRFRLSTATDCIEADLSPTTYLHTLLARMHVVGAATDGQPAESQIKHAFFEACGDDAECTQELKSNFLLGNDEDATALDAAITALDLQAIGKITHRLKGVMPLCGAVKLANVCAYLEAKLRVAAAPEEILALSSWLAGAIRTLNGTLRNMAVTISAESDGP